MAGPWEKYSQQEGPWSKYAAPVAADAPASSSVSQQALNLLAGGLRGAGSIGATIMAPKDVLSDMLDGKGLTLASNRERRKLMDQGFASLGADTDSLAYGAGKIGTEVAGTLGVGGGLANVAGRVPGMAGAPILNAIKTSGMTTGLSPVTVGQKVADMGGRMLGGAITGGASALAVDPESAGTGAMIGAALPPAIKAAGAIGSGVGGAISGAAKHTLGLSTGVGAEPIAQAFKAGKTGNKDFLANMRGDVPLTDVLDRAKQGLAAMGAEKSAQYRSGMIPIKGDQSVLSLSNLDKALDDAFAVTSFKGQVKNDSAASAVGKMREIVDEWKALDPQQFHTPEGLDALKQKLGGILESIPFQERTARLAAGKVYTAAKDTIESQAPTYAKVMKDYTEASAQIHEIERALSLGDKASKDTAMRKLQSLMRNNVQTNYGNRLTLAQSLEKGGGVDLMPSLSGQALNSFTPRSLSGQIGGGATALASLMTGNPAGLALLPFQSPRAVGSMAYGAGLLSGAPAKIGQAARQSGGLLGGAMQALPEPEAIAQFGYRVAPGLAVGR